MKDHSRVHSSRSQDGRRVSQGRSRSKSRGREGASNGHSSSNRSKSKSRSKSKQRQSQSSKAPQDNDKSKRKSTTNQGNNSNKSKRKLESAAKDGKRSASGAAEFNAKKRSQKFATQASKAIPASVRMISGSHDSQTSADVKNIKSQFALPNPAGMAGGACTAALLEVLYGYHDDGYDNVSWVDVLREMRSVLGKKGFDQIPQLTSSRMIDVHDPFIITPSSFSSKKNTKRAVLIGINYEGQKGELSGCHNDVRNIAKYLKEVQGFKDSNVTILMDDGRHKNPTKSEIMKAYKKIVKESDDGDVVFCHYSGMVFVISVALALS